jgi:TPR repeat protein
LANHLIDTGGDPKRVFQLFKSSARAGLDVSQQNLSKCLGDGWGCNVDVKESFKWLLRAANGGNPDAQARACELYRLGVEGVIKSDKKAFHYASMSYDRCLAGLYEMGMCWRDKTDPDAKKKMIICFKQAAEAGYPNAMLRLGDYFYESSEGGAADEYDLAFEWMKKAAEQIEESEFVYLMFL